MTRHHHERENPEGASVLRDPEHQGRLYGNPRDQPDPAAIQLPGRDQAHHAGRDHVHEERHLVIVARRHPRPPLAHGVALRLSGGRRADPLPPRLPSPPAPRGPRRQAPRNVASILDSVRELGIRDAHGPGGLRLERLDGVASLQAGPRAEAAGTAGTAPRPLRRGRPAPRRQDVRGG